MSSTLQSDVQQWKETLVQMKIPVGVTIREEDEDDRWMDEDYVEKSWASIEGIVDGGTIVVAHCDNPCKDVTLIA